MSAVALRSGRYRVENGAFVFERPFEDVVDKCHDKSADPLGVRAAALVGRNVMTFWEAS